MPTLDDIKTDLEKSNGEIKKGLSDLSGRLDQQQRALDEMKAKGERPETPEHIAKKIDKLDDNLADHQKRVTELQDELKKNYADAVKRMDELQASMQRTSPGASGEEIEKSVGEQVVEFFKSNEKLLGSRTRLTNFPNLPLKGFEASLGFSGMSLGDVKKALTTNATTNFVPVRQVPGYMPIPRRRLRMRDILPVVPIEQPAYNKVLYLRQTGFTTIGANSVTSITRSGSTVTVTQTAHGYRNFDLVLIAGAAQTEYNGSWRIKVTGANTYTFNLVSGTPTTPATGAITAKRLNNYGAANFVAEAGLKPEADMTFEEREATVRTIAHWIKATRQVLNDLPGLRTRIDGDLTYGLLRREEDALLYGTGLGEQIQGFMTELGVQTYSWSQGLTNDTKADAIRRASTLVELADLEASATIIHPSVWEEIELEKSSTREYIWVRSMDGLGNPVSMWRQPLVVTAAIDYTQFLTGGFAFGARIHDREEANVRVSDQNEDNFVRNMMTILAEERLTLVIDRPEAFVKGTYDTAPA